MATETPGALLRRWFDEVWNGRDTAIVHQCLGPDSVLRNPGAEGGALRGPDGFLAFRDTLLRAFPDIALTVHEVVESGPMAAARWSARMTHTGPGLGIPPSGAPVTITGMTMARVENGKVVEAWDEWDQLKLSTACGLVAPAQAA